MSVVLYAAIIGIWLFMLVPRWLRRAHEPQAVSYEAAAPAYQGSPEEDVSGDDYAADAGYAAGEGPEAGPETEPEPGSAAGDASAPVRRAGLPPARRSRVLQARRRLLTILVLLTAVAGTCVALKLTSYWACVPPGVMLALYLLLLREAASADAEQARRRAVTERRAEAARQRAHELWVQEEEEYSAQIIDISARVGDQLYDQYADATDRAVGD